MHRLRFYSLFWQVKTVDYRLAPVLLEHTAVAKWAVVPAAVSGSLSTPTRSDRSVPDIP